MHKKGEIEDAKNCIRLYCRHFLKTTGAAGFGALNKPKLAAAHNPASGDYQSAH